MAAAFIAKLLESFQPKRVRTPTLLQMEAVECGAASLGIVLGYYGRIVPLPELRRDCGVSRDGSKASNVIKAARNYGMEAKGFRKSIEELKAMSPPFIVFWNFNHFLVVEGLTQRWAYLNDPAVGRRTVSLAEFDQSYTGVVLALQPGPDFQRGGHKRSLPLALYSRLQHSRTTLLFCLLAGLLLTLPRLAVPAFTQVFIDEVLVQNQLDWLRPLVLGMLLTALLQGVLARLRLLYLRQLMIKLSVAMAGRFIWHTLRLPINFYAQRFAGEISSRIQINDRVADVLSGKLATTVIDAIMMVFYFLIMVQYDGLLTGIAVSFALLNFVGLQWLSRSRVDANLQLAQEHGKVAGVAIGGIQVIETVKASGLEADLFTRFAGYYAKALNAQQELGLRSQMLTVLPVLLTALTTAAILVVGGLRVIEGTLTIGMLVAYQLLTQSFLQPINSLLNFGGTLQELEADLDRLDDVLQNPVEIDEHHFAGESASYTSQSFQLQGYLTLHNITFGYSRLESPLIENFELRVKPGQRIALVGSSGSGKSTIAKLICGLYQPWSGEVCFDSIPRQELSPAVIANALALVEQDIFQFSGTIRDNLTLWDATVLQADLVKACQDAAIHDLILSLPGGYDAELIEGGMNLSGGQRQRLEIARALVRNPSLLVLDEATSALDAETELLIDRNLRQRGCTCIIVAHRLSTIRDCDEIIVLERGKVVQRGSHDELWQAEGLYAHLIRSEAGE